MGTLRHSCLIIIVFLVNLLFASIDFKPPVVQQQIRLPLRQDVGAIKLSLQESSRNRTEISYKGSLSRNCTGISLSPMEAENVTTPVEIILNINGSSYLHTESFTCIFSVKTASGDKTSIKINIAIVSDLCTYQEDPTSYCHSATSLHSYCAANGTCACNTNYFGKKCDHFCDASTCSHRGECNAEGVCECQQDFWGPKCEYQRCSLNCSVHGKCNNVTGKCDCEKNYYGSTCTTFCDKKQCGEYGKCDSTTGECSCNDFWFGSRCQNHCNATTCGSQGSCDQNGECQCKENYYGRYCEVMCLSSNCGHGFCNVTSGACICEHNFFGEECDVFCDNSTTCNDRGYCRYDGYCECEDLLYFGYECQINKLVFGGAVAGSAIFVVIILGVIMVIRKNMKGNQGYELLTPEDHSLN